jgi:hypothetical protein
MTAAEQDIRHLVSAAFRQPSWRVHRPIPGSGPQPALIVEGGGSKYLVQYKRSSEGRRDRIIPLLSQAILEAQSTALHFPELVIPVAVIAAPHIPQVLVDAVQDYAHRVAPQMGIGLVDSHGLRAFAGQGLEVLNARPGAMQHSAHQRISSPRLPHLFSDLNQWMLKILLANSIPAGLLSAPRAHYRNPTQLARAAGVSVMSAFRLVRQLAREGFIDPQAESLELVRIPDLLNRWSSWRDAIQEFPVRSPIKRDAAALIAALKSCSASGPRQQPRLCLGLFAAADALGFGFVHGVPPHIYLERADPHLLEHLGLSAENAEHQPDAFIRIPANPQSLFRAAVTKDGLPCTDILQVWLDVSSHPSRGRQQAHVIARRALSALLGSK